MLQAVTWFNLAPHGLALRIRGAPVPARAITASNYVVLGLVSALMCWVLDDGLQIEHLNEIVNRVCYGVAMAGPVWAAYVLWQSDGHRLGLARSRPVCASGRFHPRLWRDRRLFEEL